MLRSITGAIVRTTSSFQSYARQIDAYLVVPSVDARATGDGENVPRRMEGDRDDRMTQRGNVQTAPRFNVPESASHPH